MEGFVEGRFSRKRWLLGRLPLGISGQTVVSKPEHTHPYNSTEHHRNKIDAFAGPLRICGVVEAPLAGAVFPPVIVLFRSLDLALDAPR